MRNLFTSLAALVLVTSCTSFRFEGVEKTSERYDSEIGAYVVGVRFEVLKGDLPVQGLRGTDFRLYEDDVRATTESIQEIDHSELKLPVVLLLDTSYSIYREDAIAALKSAASNFVDELSATGFEVTVVSFNSQVELVDVISTIPESWERRENSTRWTSLYFATSLVLEEHPNAILVVFSDGADNYSQNHGVRGFAELEPLIGDRQIHTVGFGDVRDEFDREGNSATKVLRRMARNGTYRYAADEQALAGVFDYISRRLRNIYYVEYYSPNHAGAHELVIKYQGAETEPLPFTSQIPDASE